MTANLKIWTLADESGDDPPDTFIVQDGHSYWIQGCATKTKAAAETASCLLAEIPASVPKARKSPHRQFQTSLSKRVGTYNGVPIQIFLIIQKPPRPQEERFDESTKEQQQRRFHVAAASTR